MNLHKTFQHYCEGIIQLGGGSNITQATVQEGVKVALEGPKTIEIAGHRILAMPLQAITPTPEQQEQFEAAGGLINPMPAKATAYENKDKMMYGVESFETRQAEIDGTLYKGFDLFKQVYKGFPDIRSMTEAEAREAGLYPEIHCYNFAALEWVAERYGGHLATLGTDYKGELIDIYNAATGGAYHETLAAMGQALFGWHHAGDAKVYGLGESAALGGGWLKDKGNVRILVIGYHGNARENFDWHGQSTALSGVVVLDK